jgi:putative membrane protein
MSQSVTTSATHLPSNTDLAFERTILAHERTLMAWVRTATSMVSFGFTIYKFFQEVQHNAPNTKTFLSPRIFGIIMIGFGILSLLLAQIQHYKAMKKLKEAYPASQRSISSVLSILILVFGLFLFLSAVFRQ